MLPPPPEGLAIEQSLSRYTVRFQIPRPPSSSATRRINQTAAVVFAATMLAPLLIGLMAPDGLLAGLLYLLVTLMFSSWAWLLFQHADHEKLLGMVELTPTMLHLRDRNRTSDRLLEEIRSIRQEGGALQIDAQPHFPTLAPQHTDWLVRIIRHHVEARRQSLHRQGHDLSRAASPPADLHTLRQR